MKTITFYSYKGGAGRTLALANTAIFAARGGLKVVALDFDLEAPGLGYKLFRKQPASSIGLVGFLRETMLFQQSPRAVDCLVDRHVPGTEESGGWLKFMPAGRPPSANYSTDLLNLKLDQRLDDGSALDALDDLKQQFVAMGTDLLLIDARTGITASNRVTTHVLADEVVAFMLDFPEQLEGMRSVLQSIQPLTSLTTGAHIKVHAVVSRIRRQSSPNFAEIGPDDRRVEKRIVDYLTEPAATLNRTLSVGSFNVLHHDSSLVSRELLFLEEVGAAESVLRHDYLRLVTNVLGDQPIVGRAVSLSRQSTSPLARPPETIPTFAFDELNTSPLPVSVEHFRRIAKSNAVYLPDLAWELLKFDIALGVVGKYEEALKVSQEALDLASAIQNPDNPASKFLLAKALDAHAVNLARLDRRQDSFEYLTQAIEMYSEIALQDPMYAGDLARCLCNLSINLQETASPGEALASAEEAAEIRRKRSAANPQEPQYLREVASSLGQLCVLYTQLGRIGDAAEVGQTAVDTFQRLGPSGGLSNESARALHHLAMAQDATGQHESAIKNGRAAVELFRGLSNSRFTERNLQLGKSLRNQALRTTPQGDFDLTISLFEESIENLRDTNDRLELAISLQMCAQFLSATGSPSAAITAFDEVCLLYSELETKGLEPAILDRIAADHVSAKYNSAIAFRQLGDTASALMAGRSALQLFEERKHQPAVDPRAKAMILTNLGVDYRNLARNEEALSVLAEAIEVWGEVISTQDGSELDLTRALFAFASSSEQLGNIHEAETAVRRGTEILRELSLTDEDTNDFLAEKLRDLERLTGLLVTDHPNE